MAVAARRVLLPLGLFLALAVALGSWALSSPPGSSPDDPFHLASIWCVQDLPGSECAHAGGTADPGTVNRLLPKDVVGSPCYAMDSGKSARCERFLDQKLVSGPANAGLYPTGFYRVMHLFVGKDVARSVLTMRAVNALIGAVMITVALVLAPRGLRRGSALSWMVGLVPLGMFFIPSTNPTSWTVTGIGTYWVFLLAFLTGPRAWTTWVAGALAVVSALLAVSSRVDGSAYLCVVTAACLLLASSRPRDVLTWRSALPVGIGLAAFIRFLTLQSSNVLVSGASPHDASEPGRHGVGLLANNLFNLPTFLAGMFGQTFGLGWLDTYMPSAVGATTGGVAVALLLLSVGSYWTWKRVAVGLLAAATVAVPVLVLQQSHAFVGEVVQPRYVYPLVLVLYGGAAYSGVRDEAPPFFLRRAHLFVFTAAAAVANAVALHTEIKRYVTGLDVRDLNLDARREWWWSSGPGPMLLWTLGSVAGLALFWLLAALAPPDRAGAVERTGEAAPDEEPVAA